MTDLHRHLATAALAVGTIAMAAGCGSDDAGPPATVPGVPELPADPNVVVLQLQLVQNQPEPLFRWRNAIDFTLTAGGQLIASDPAAPYQPVTPLQAATLSPEGVAELLDRAREAGLYDPLDDYGFSELADATTTVFRTADGAEVSVYDLDSNREYREATNEQFAALERLEVLEDDLLAWTDSLAEWIVDGPTTYVPERVMVMSSTLYPPESDDALAAELLEGAPRVDAGNGGGDYRCAELAGPELDAVWARLADPDADIRREIAVKPLVPGEPGCDQFAPA